MRTNETVSESGASAAHNNPDGMSIGYDTEVGPEATHHALGTATVIHKDEELPYAGKPITYGANSPQVDKEGMEIMGESGAGATGKDING